MSTNCISNKREVGIDFIKVLACFGVVALHTIQPGKGCVNRVITLLAVTSIPLFFMVSGYLMFKRKEVNYRYVFKKILRILLICLAWEFLHATAYLLYYGKPRDFFTSYVLDFFQKGLFFHFWYMGALILMYLVIPLLYRLYKRSADAYLITLVALAVICGVIDIGSLVFKRQFILAVPQNLRCWTWLLYVMAGGLIATEGNAVRWFDKLSGCIKVLLMCLTLLISSAWQFWAGSCIFGSIAVEEFYGSFPAFLATVTVFLFCRSNHILESAKKTIFYLSSLTMGIYIMHPFVLAVLNKFIPAFTQSGMGMNLLSWIVVIIVSTVGSAIIRMIPGLKWLLRL